MPRTLPPLVGLVLLAAVTPAAAITGVAAGPRAVLPSSAESMGMLCLADTAAFRLWWSETPGAAGALTVGADGDCATVPPLIDDLGLAAENARVQAVALGFPDMVGDAAPLFERDPLRTRALLRMTPPDRVRNLLTTPARSRGAYLAGLSDAVRARILTGMRSSARNRFERDLRAAQQGRPTDFVGGDRRVDVVVDGTGATNMVRTLQPGVTPCTMRGTGPGFARRAFKNAHVVVLATGTSPRATLVHELFHVVQCNLSSSAGTPTLAVEGAAEWFAAQVEPASFATAPTPGTDGGSTLVGGSSRVVSFCNGFDPEGTGLDPYNSWGVWRALEGGGATSGTVLPMLRSYAGAASRTSGGGAVQLVGTDRWVQALRTATQSLCGSLRAPFGDLAFPAAVREFFGSGQAQVSMGGTQSITVPAWGTESVVALWGTAASATITLTSPQASAADLAASAVATASSGPLAATVRGNAAVIDIPAASLAAQSLPVTIANPLRQGALTVTVTLGSAPTV